METKDLIFDFLYFNNHISISYEYDIHYEDENEYKTETIKFSVNDSFSQSQIEDFLKSEFYFKVFHYDNFLEVVLKKVSLCQ